MTTVTPKTSRSGSPIWVVQWGPGLTQMAICLTLAEVDEVTVTHRPARGSVEPLVGLRAS